jgi:hypothetical protein
MSLPTPMPLSEVDGREVVGRLDGVGNLEKFAPLLAAHLQKGTGPGRLGEEWSIKAFAYAVGLNDRSIRNWIAGRTVPSDLRGIELVLFGKEQSSSRSERLELRAAHAFDRKARAKTVDDEGPSEIPATPVDGTHHQEATGNTHQTNDGTLYRNNSPRLKIVGLNELASIGWTARKVLDRMGDLDRKLYDGLTEETEGTTEQWLPMYTQLPDTWRALVADEKTLIGYWNTAVFNSEFYSAVRAGLLMEGDLKMEYYALLDMPGIYNLYFVSICLDPDYRERVAQLMLLESFLCVINRLSLNDVFFDEVITNAYSPEGLRLSKHVGLRYLCQHSNGGEIYVGSMKVLLQTFQLSIKKTFPSLIERYREAGLF